MPALFDLNCTRSYIVLRQPALRRHISMHCHIACSYTVALHPWSPGLCVVHGTESCTATAPLRYVSPAARAVSAVCPCGNQCTSSQIFQRRVNPSRHSLPAHDTWQSQGMYLTAGPSLLPAPAATLVSPLTSSALPNFLASAITSLSHILTVCARCILSITSFITSHIGWSVRRSRPWVMCHLTWG